MPPKRVAVVILNWNGRAFLRQFLPGVIRHSAHIADIVVIDNGSTDDSIACLRENFPEVKVMDNTQNLGFAGGYNKGLEKVDNEYYILLNSDIEVTEGWIEPLLQYMDEHLGVAACQPKLLSWQQPEYFEYAGASGGFIDNWGYPFCRGRLFQLLEKDEGQYDEPVRIFWASGASMFIRRNAFWEVGGFDPDFFAHMEEIDLCWRLQHLGYEIHVVPSSKVYHIGGGTLPKQSWRKTYLNMRNNGLMLIKNLPRRRLPFVLTARLFLDFAAALKFLADGGFRNFFAVFRAHASILRQFRKALLKRRLVRPDDKAIIYRGSIVWAYFIAGKRHYSELQHEKFR
ncbi:MAG: glycosyltransferase family 2 protein [Bacteroidales bacterium]